MRPLLLQSAYIGLRMPLNGYKKVEGKLPTPSYENILISSSGEKEIIIVYEIKHHLKTSKQYQWLSDIKIHLKRNLFVDFDFVTEFYINEYSTCRGIKYSLDELSKVFKGEFIKYPKAMYPATKKELYRKLVWYALRLKEKGLLTLEAIYAVALKFNQAIGNEYQQKELYKKSYVAYNFILAHHRRKTKQELILIKRQNGVKRGRQRTQERHILLEQIKKLIPQHSKPNGKPNLSAIARELNVRRETVSRIFKLFIAVSFIFWIKTSLEYDSFSKQSERVANGYTILRSAKVTLFRNAYFKGFERGQFYQKSKKG